MDQCTVDSKQKPVCTLREAIKLTLHKDLLTKDEPHWWRTAAVLGVDDIHYCFNRAIAIRMACEKAESELDLQNSIAVTLDAVASSQPEVSNTQETVVFRASQEPPVPQTIPTQVDTPTPNTDTGDTPDLLCACTP